MKRILTAIALMASLASPSLALMKDGMTGFADTPPPPQGKVLVLVAINSNLTENCYGYGAYRFYHPDMVISVRTIDGTVYDSVRPNRTLLLDTGRCNYLAYVKIPFGVRFYFSISGVIIPGELYDMTKDEDGGYFARIADLDLSYLLEKGLKVED